MKWVSTFTLVVLISALSACNSSSSSSSVSTTARYASAQVESFNNDAALRDQMLQTRGASFAADADCVPNDLYAADPNYVPEAWLVYDRDTAAESIDKLVVFAHGNGHSVGGATNPLAEGGPAFTPGYWVGHMRTQLRLAKAKGLNVAFVATDYRDNFGFPALWGAQDTITATLYALERFPNVETVYLMGVSMGGAVSGTAITEAFNAGIKKADDTPLFDYWIDVEGVAQLAETWSEARSVGDATNNDFAVQAANGIERDAGGQAPTCPLAYQRRSPGANVPFILQAGIRAATLVHAVNDGLVPYNQSRELATQLTGATIPTQFFTVTTTYFYDPGTTATSHTGLDDALAEYNDPSSSGAPVPPTGDFSGHASERYYFHPVMATAFANLELMLEGTYREDVPYFECVVDDTYNFSSSFVAATFEMPLPESCQLDQIPQG